MDPLSVLVVPGLAGGVFVALSLAIVHQRFRSSDLPVRREDGILLDAINISHIPVDGIGGLGLVAGALIVAALVPSVGASLAVALTAGVVIGAGLILWRRRA